MAYAPVRSASAALNEGLTDGKYKKVSPNRGGFVEVTTQNERDDLKDTWYGIHEAPAKEDQFGRSISTPEFIHTGPAEPTV